MKFLPLILANLFRKKIRTTLTVGSFAVALFLFGLLVTIRGAFNQGVEVAGADRLVVINKVSLIQPLPRSYADDLLALPGVKQVTFANWFGGVYQDERNFFPQFAIDVSTYREMFPEFVISDDAWKAFAADRQGCIVGRSLADRFGWKVGDRIPIRGAIFPGNWEFNLHGIYTGSRPQDDATQFWFHYDYLEERFGSWIRGRVGWYTVRVANPDQAAQVVKAIDERFANSPFETHTDTEKAFAASFVKQMGNIEFLIMTIGSVVFFTLLLVTGNTMAIAVRERVGELAVFKTIGYSDRFVLGLVIVESVVVAVLGGGVGIGSAKAVSVIFGPSLLTALSGFLPSFYMPPLQLIVGFGLAVLVGLAAGLVPAVSAMRLKVVDALRRV
ncbi:MAG TPA: FtsX-like permease family protein [Vicinamibacteria bacterium]|nr:FtsX-like permease family protein [Vicinamibacteria bacterium]